MQWFAQWPHWSWLSPQWLWALAALAIPLAIHLLRRSHPREITFAALYWLRPQRARRWRHLQLRDRWLLLLRCVLFALLALMLAQPLLQRTVQAEDDALLVDPRIDRTALNDYLNGHGEFARIYWLQAEPAPIDSPRPPAPDLWRALSALADDARFRRARILLASAQNPGGHRALRVSPHWQWQALHNRNARPQALASVALLGAGPPWLQPAIRSLADTTLPQLALTTLRAGDNVDARQVDWLIYDTAGPLPAALRQFIAAGGLLITDRRVHPRGTLAFIPIDGDEPLEAAAIGRGSWLRYGRDWHSGEFYRRADLPQILWQQWRAQDWALQTHSRANWSIDAVPGIAIPDTAVQHTRWTGLERVLLWVFALLLALERLIVLTRSAATPATDAEQRA